MKILGLTPVIAAMALFAGCGTTVSVRENEKVAMSVDAWTGDWLAPSRSYFGHESTSGFHLAPNGTGYFISSSIFEPRHTPSLWVTRTDFRWSQVSPSTIRVSTTGRMDLAGSGTYGIWAKTKGFDIIATDLGVRVNGMGKEKAIFLKYPGKLPADMATAITDETRARSSAMGGNENPYQGPTFGQVASGALKTYQQGLSAGN